MSHARTFPRTTALFLAAATLIGCGQQDAGVDDAVNSENLMLTQAYLDSAERYRGQGQFRAGVIEIQNALQAVPGHVDSLLLLARINMDIGDLLPAEQILEQLSEFDPENDEVALISAEFHLLMGDYDDSRALLGDLQATQSELRSRQSLLLGKLAAIDGDSASAEASYLEVLEIDPVNVEALIDLSKLAFREGDTQQSTSYLEQAMTIAANDVDVLMWQGQRSMLQQQYPQAEEAFFDALEVMSSYDTMTSKRYLALQSIIVPLQLQQKDDEALRYSSLLAETPQGQFQNSYADAMSIVQSGDYVAAEQSLTDLLARNPSHPGSNILLGLTQMAQGSLFEAEATLSAFVNSNTSSPAALRALAAVQMRLGQSVNAEAVLEEATYQYPEDAALIAMLGISQLVQGNYADARGSLNRAAELQPDDASIRISLASVHLALEDPESARVELEQAVTLAPDSVDAKSNLVQLLLQQGDNDTARSLVQDWINQQPSSVAITNLAGAVALTDGRAREARQLFYASLGLGDNPDARMFLAQLDIQEQEFDAALGHYLEVVTADASNATALAGILALGQETGSVSERIQDIENLIGAQPGAFTPPLVLAQFFLSLGDVENAANRAAQAFDLADNLYTRNILAQARLLQVQQARIAGDLATARQLVSEVLEVQSDNVQARIAAIAVANEAGDTDSAATQIATMQESFPDLPIVYEVEGDFLLAQNELQGAVAAFRQSWERSTSSSVGYKLYQVLNQQGRPDEAARILDRWLDEVPDDVNANVLSGLRAQQGGLEDEAIARYETAIAADSENQLALNNLAWLYQDSQPQRALELATRAAELYPDNADVLDTYGWILHRQDRSDEAVAILRRAVELAPDSQAIAEHLNTALQ